MSRGTACICSDTTNHHNRSAIYIIDICLKKTCLLGKLGTFKINDIRYSYKVEPKIPTNPVKKHFFKDSSCLRGRFFSKPPSFSTLLHNDPAAHQDLCWKFTQTEYFDYNQEIIFSLMFMFKNYLVPCLVPRRPDPVSPQAFYSIGKFFLKSELVSF